MNEMVEIPAASNEVDAKHPSEKRQHTAQQNFSSLREQPRSDNNIPFFCHASSSLGMTKSFVASSEVEKRQHTAQQNFSSLREQPRSDKLHNTSPSCPFSLGMTKSFVTSSEVEKE